MTDLRTLAEAATPGPWRPEDTTDQFYDPDDPTAEATGWVVGPDTVDVGDYYTFRYADAAYIAAANPTVVLALLGVVDAARARVGYMSSTPWSLQADDRLRAALARYEEVTRDPA